MGHTGCACFAISTTIWKLYESWTQILLLSPTRAHRFFYGVLASKRRGKLFRQTPWRMATRKTLKLMRTSFATGQNFALHPCVWRRENSDNHEGIRSFVHHPGDGESGFSILYWFLATIHSYVFSAFVSNFYEDTSVEKKVYMGFVVAFHLFPVLFHLNILHASGDLAQFVTSYFKFYCDGKLETLTSNFKSSKR